MPSQKAVVEDIYINERTSSPSNYKFFGRHEHVDPRILMVEENAEKEFYDRQRNQMNYQQSIKQKEYEEKVRRKLEKQRQNGYIKEEISISDQNQRDMTFNGVQQNNSKNYGVLQNQQQFYDTLNERDSNFQMSQQNSQRLKQQLNQQQIGGGYQQGVQIYNQNDSRSYQGNQNQNRMNQNSFNVQNQDNLRDQRGLANFQQQYQQNQQNQHFQQNNLSNQGNQNYQRPRSAFNYRNQQQNQRNIPGQYKQTDPRQRENQNFQQNKNFEQTQQSQQNQNQQQKPQQYLDYLPTGNLRTNQGLNNLYMSSSNGFNKSMSSSRQQQLHQQKQYNESRHTHCKEKHLALTNKNSSMGFRDTFYSTNGLGSTMKNNFQEVDHLIIQAKALIHKKKYQKAKDVLESSINKFNVDHADVFYLCGEANRRLGNFIVAEQMFLRCLQYELHSPFTYSALGYVYRDLGQLEKACQLFKRALEQQKSPQVSFELAKIMASQKYLTESMSYFTQAIELAEDGLRSEVGIELLSEYYMHRSCVYEALGLIELAKRDQLKIIELDEKFELKYQEEILRLENEGRYQETERIKEFLYKLKSL